MESPDHLSERDVAGYLDQSLGTEERSRIDAHIDICPDCRAELIEVMRIAPALSRGRRPTHWVWIPAAAAAGLAAILLLRPAPTNPQRSVERPTAGSAEALPRLTVTTPGNGDSVVAGRVVFQWRSRVGDSYRVTVLSESGEPLWTEETTDTAIALPPSVTLQAGRLYFWRVDAVADGLSATSGVQRFQVVR